ncbi:class I SAM-dependent methyltransferase [Acaryochloris sp. IP29b_bin.137]|uniref:class I SAM-dependent methyltransferase n=1 Tax=Acaryochloris sp. IP29b_bin.137 TaxID=2969217 RepID=UPI00260F743C|nr:class I SAM-dependent methyltransferase [Acaryochloris sp. IP29b_bin.137]
MENLELVIDLHQHGDRQGPGGKSETERAITLASLDTSQHLKIADLGCGTGASTLCLANKLNADIIAVDFIPEFIEILRRNAEASNLSQHIHPKAGSMDDLEFINNELDVIWSEGAIYNIGFEQGINYWREFLKPKGVLAVSEITWLTDHRPDEIQAYWDAQYPEINTASSKIKLLEEAGYALLGYFVLPERCWLDNYYHPLQQRFAEFLDRHSNSDDAQDLVEAEKQEIQVFEQFKAYFSYGFYIASKLP